jgi:hypothetical protein
MMNPRQFAELSENGDEPTLEKPGRDASLELMLQSLGLLHKQQSAKLAPN